jgi:alpha-ketoglutarate-dependent taurine dioxygenase
MLIDGQTTLFDAHRSSRSEFLAGCLADIKAAVGTVGAAVIRGLDLTGTVDFEATVRAVAGEPLSYSERSSPRSSLGNNIYTSTEYPADQEILLHNENSYQARWPMRLAFHCMQPPMSGGATPLADTRQILDSIDREVVAEFRRRGWMVVRNFHSDIGLSWREVFGCETRDAVEAYCHDHQLTCEWRGDLLRTTAIRRAVHRHPVTGEQVWFNHATVFHIESMPAEARDSLMEMFAEDELPSNTYFGDGKVIPPETIKHLRQAYDRCRRRFDYQRNDVIIIDNMLTSHGRESYVGPRSIAVAMADLSPVAAPFTVPVAVAR